MNIEAFGKVFSRLGRSISFGLMGFGKGYRNFLLILAVMIGIVVGFQHRQMQFGWLGCGPDVNGSLYFICLTKHWLFPGLFGLIAGATVIMPWAAILGIFKVFKLIKFERAFAVIGLKNSLGLY